MGGDDGRAAAEAHRLARQGLDAEVGDARGASERALHRAGEPVPRDRATSGRIPRGCRSARCSSAGAARGWCRWCTRPATGSTAPSSARSWAARRRPRPPGRSAICGATRWRCCPSADTTWPTTGRTGSRIGQRKGAKLPKIYYVNWFRKSADGDFLWPGFGENSRVLKWVFERCEGTAKAVETPIGNLPAKGALDTQRPGRLRGGSRGAAARRRRGVAGGGARHPRVLRDVRGPRAEGAARGARRAEATAGVRSLVEAVAHPGAARRHPRGGSDPRPRGSLLHAGARRPRGARDQGGGPGEARTLVGSAPSSKGARPTSSRSTAARRASPSTSRSRQTAPSSRSSWRGRTCSRRTSGPA